MRLSGGQGDGAGSGRSNPVAAFFGCDNDRRLSESTDESSDPWSWEARETAPLKDILPGIHMIHGEVEGRLEELADRPSPGVGKDAAEREALRSD